VGYEVIYEALIEVKGFLVQSLPVTPKRLCCSSCLLFDMRLIVFGLPPLAVPQLIKANKPRSIIYAVIVHEV